MYLILLGSGNGLQLEGDIFGIAKGNILVIVTKFCHMARLHLWKTFVQFPSQNQFKDLSKEFEALHGIPHIINAIDGSQIPILTPLIEGEDYNCRKPFHIVLL